MRLLRSYIYINNGSEVRLGWRFNFQDLNLDYKIKIYHHEPRSAARPETADGMTRTDAPNFSYRHLGPLS